MLIVNIPNGFGLGYGQTTSTAGFKPPTVVVGANIYLRERIKRETLQDWDVTLLFFPTSEPVYTIGILYVSRKDDGVVSLDICKGTTVAEAIEHVLATPVLSETIVLKPKAIMWLASSIYACPKVFLKDLLGLEAFEGIVSSMGSGV